MLVRWRQRIKNSKFYSISSSSEHLPTSFNVCWRTLSIVFPIDLFLIDFCRLLVASDKDVVHLPFLLFLVLFLFFLSFWLTEVFFSFLPLSFDSSTCLLWFVYQSSVSRLLRSVDNVSCDWSFLSSCLVTSTRPTIIAGTPVFLPPPTLPSSSSLLPTSQLSVVNLPSWLRAQIPLPSFISNIQVRHLAYRQVCGETLRINVCMCVCVCVCVWMFI